MTYSLETSPEPGTVSLGPLQSFQQAILDLGGARRAFIGTLLHPWPGQLEKGDDQLLRSKAPSRG